MKVILTSQVYCLSSMPKKEKKMKSKQNFQTLQYLSLSSQ